MQSFAVGLIFEKIIFITRLVQIGINRAVQDAFFSRVVTGIINYGKAIAYAKTKLFLDMGSINATAIAVLEAGDKVFVCNGDKL